MPKHLLRHLMIQFAAIFAVLSLMWPYQGFSSAPYPTPFVALAIGATAYGIAAFTQQPWWWRLIHLVFAPLAWLVAQLSIDPLWFLLAFTLLITIFRSAAGGQIPLYLSGGTATELLADLVENRQCARFIDLGAGIGSTLRPLARQFPMTHFVGIENSPLPWFIGWLRTRHLKNVEWRWGDLWTTDLSSFDIAYAFLSPAPMSSLGRKAEQEMRPGTLLASNSFPIPERPPSGSTSAQTVTLYLYTQVSPTQYSSCDASQTLPPAFDT